MAFYVFFFFFDTRLVFRVDSFKRIYIHKYAVRVTILGQERGRSTCYIVLAEKKDEVFPGKYKIYARIIQTMMDFEVFRR